MGRGGSSKPRLFGFELIGKMTFRGPHTYSDQVSPDANNPQRPPHCSDMTAQIKSSRRHVSLGAPPPTPNPSEVLRLLSSHTHDAPRRSQRQTETWPFPAAEPAVPTSTFVQSSADPFACNRVKCSPSRGRPFPHSPNFLPPFWRSGAMGAIRELGVNWWLWLQASSVIPSHLHPRTWNHPSRRGSQGGRLSATQTGKTIPWPTTAAARIQEPREACEHPPLVRSAEKLAIMTIPRFCGSPSRNANMLASNHGNATMSLLVGISAVVD